MNLTARNADRLAAFYKDTFGLTERRPPKRLSGEVVSRGNGLPNCDIYAIWLNFNGDTGSFLEIMQYHKTVHRPTPAVNEPGFAHLAFEVRDLAQSVEKLLRCGGSLQGEITNFGTDKAPLLVVYVRDPEGNILELEQASDPENRSLPLP